MKNNELIPALNDKGFVVGIFDKKYIEAQLNIKNKHDKVIVVTSEAMTQAKAELAYGITKTNEGMELTYYNKHCSRSEFALTYTLLFENEEHMLFTLFNHVKRTSQILINLMHNNNDNKETKK